MFKEVLRHMDLAQAPVFALVLFVVTFSALLVHTAFFRPGAHDARLNALPLDDAAPEPREGR